MKESRHEEALRLYERALAKQPLARNDVQTRIAHACLALAAERNRSGDRAGAIVTLAQGYNPRLQHRLKERIRHAYAEYYTRHVAEEIAAVARAHGWRTLGVVPFVELSEHEVDGRTLAGRIGRALADAGNLSVSVRSISARGAGMLMTGIYDEIPHEDRAQLESWGDDGLVLGRIGREVSAFVSDMTTQRTDVVHIAENLAFDSGAPRRSFWDELAANRPADSKFQVRVWPEKETYPVGGSLRLFVRSTRECFLTLLSLPTDGSAHAFLPILEQQRNYIVSGRTYAIPDRNGRPFELPIEGPPGVEQIKVIATARPVDVGIVGTALSEDDVADILAARLAALDPGEWAVAGCAFNVVE